MHTNISACQYGIALTYLWNFEWKHFFFKLWRVVIHIQNADAYISFVDMDSVSDFYLRKYEFKMLKHLNSQKYILSIKSLK